jgi:hypothetical protein
MSIKIATPGQPIHIVDGAAFNTFTAFQDISPAPAIVIPQQTLEQGLELFLFACGEFSNTGTPTLALGFWFNTAATILAQNALTATVTAAASWPWQMEWRGRLRLVGPGASGGTWNGQGEVKVGGSLTAWQSGFPAPIPTTLALRTVTCDVTAARAVGVGAAWGTSAAANSIKVNQFSVQLATGY